MHLCPKEKVFRFGLKMLLWYHCQHVFAIPWTRQSWPSLFSLVLITFSFLTTIACCRFREERTTLTTACGGMVRSARFCPLWLSRCFAMVFMVSRAFFFAFFSIFVLLFWSRVCLLVVSRLLGLTLRRSAPICSCQWTPHSQCMVAFGPARARNVVFLCHSRCSSLAHFQEEVQSCSPSTLTSASNRSTFMTRGEVCKIKSLKENKDGVHKVFSHVPHSGQPQKLAIAHEAVREIFCVYSIVLRNHDVQCATWFLTAYEEGPFTRC